MAGQLIQDTRLNTTIKRIFKDMVEKTPFANYFMSLIQYAIFHRDLTFGIATSTASAPLPVSQTLPPKAAVVTNPSSPVAVDETIHPPPLAAQPPLSPPTAAITLAPNPPCQAVPAPTETEPAARTLLAPTLHPLQSQTSPSSVTLTTLTPNKASLDVPAVFSPQPAASSSLAQAPTSPAPTTSQLDAFTLLASTPLSHASLASTAAKGNATELPDQKGPNDSGISLDVELGAIEDNNIENTVCGGLNSKLSNPAKIPGSGYKYCVCKQVST
ncbi:uncharacterized protein LOC111319378 [Stylophora pistillata]|uniref:uncharacterized protein LOC111319378 n=1 Tax=Stylophora pistillata TaxID=50429 RepID=UPI000C041933|nr:uncharacterized protein LOC111319378 [Stylophora pistillata]